MDKNEKIDILFEALKNDRFEHIPSQLKTKKNHLMSMFLAQVAQLMPNKNESEILFAGTDFPTALAMCINYLFQEDFKLPPPRKKALQTIELVKKALKATKKAKQNGEESMFLPITCLSQLEDVHPYLGHMDIAEENLQITLNLLEKFKKWAYSNQKRFESNQVNGLWLTRGFFEKALRGRRLKIEPVRKGIFEKTNSKNIYLATPLKMTVNAVNAAGMAMTEETIRKRLKKSSVKIF